jgi:hypothetical protein
MGLHGHRNEIIQLLYLQIEIFLILEKLPFREQWLIFEENVKLDLT